LSRIAARYNVLPDAIIRRNKLSSPNLVVEGQSLIIPAAGELSPSKAEEASVAHPAKTSIASQLPAESLTKDSVSPQKKEAKGEITLQAGDRSYAVQHGDTLSRIAVRFNVLPETILRRNKLASPDLIVEGRTLIIPAAGELPQLALNAASPHALGAAPQASLRPAVSPDKDSASPPSTEHKDEMTLLKGELRYVVQLGDSLSRIAAHFNVPPDAIMLRNKLSSPDLVVAGRTLIIPAPHK